VQTTNEIVKNYCDIRHFIYYCIKRYHLLGSSKGWMNTEQLIRTDMEESGRGLCISYISTFFFVAVTDEKKNVKFGTLVADA